MPGAHSRDLAYAGAHGQAYNTTARLLDTLALAESQGINTILQQQTDALTAGRSRSNRPSAAPQSPAERQQTAGGGQHKILPETTNMRFPQAVLVQLNPPASGIRAAFWGRPGLDVQPVLGSAGGMNQGSKMNQPKSHEPNAGQNKPKTANGH